MAAPRRNCKELNFSLATNSPSSASSLNCSNNDLRTLSNLKLELDTETKYSEHVSELLTYYILTSDDLTSNFYTSLKAEVEATN